METVIKIIKTPQVEVLYDKKDITKDISKYTSSITYTDYEKGQSDELNIILKDNERKFQGAWQPKKGDKLDIKIGFTGEKLLKCGIFTIDEGSLDSSDSGDTYTIKALAASINEKVREKVSASYTNKTLIEIAKEKGKKHGFTVSGSQGNIKIKKAIQHKESDLAFLHRLAETYGYIFKLTDTVLTFTKVENLEKLKPLTTIKRADILNISLTDTSTKTYKACNVKYFSPKTGKLTSVTVKGDKTDVKQDTLYLNEKYHSKEEARVKANAALKTGQSTVSGNITLKEGNPYVIAGGNFTLDEYGNFNGKYHITQSTHTITNESYTTTCEVTKC